MTSDKASQIWKDLLGAFEEKLQYSILEQAKSVVDVGLEGSELVLMVATNEAFDFFNAQVNEQRIIIFSRPITHLEKITAVKVDAEPLR